MNRMKISTIHLIQISAALECIGWSCITVVLPSLHNKLGLSSAQVSYVAAITGLTSLFSAGLQGTLSDYFSKVSLLKLSTVGQGISQAILTLFALDILTSWPLFVAMRVLASGLKMGMIVSQAYVVDYAHRTDPSITDSRLTGMISSLMSWSNIGFLVGPVLGGFMAHKLSQPFLFSIVIFTANYCVLMMLEDSTKVGPVVSSPGTLASTTTYDDPERGMYISRNGTRGNGRIDLAEKSSIGLRRPRRRFSTDEGSGVGGEPEWDSKVDEKGKKRGGDNDSNPSLFFLLHCKFAFQISNTIYETLFAQHLQQRLQATPEQLGWMMSTVGLQAALVNGVIVPKLISNERNSNWFLMILCTCGQTVGTVLWALALSIHSSFIGAIVIGLSSNVFLSLLQGMLGSCASVPTGSRRKPGDGKAPSGSSSGMTYGLSTVVDRGARALAPLIAASSLQAHFHVPTFLYHFIGSLGPGPGPGEKALKGIALSTEEAEALSVVHANETLGLALVCALAGAYTLCLLGSFYLPRSDWGSGNGTTKGGFIGRRPPALSITSMTTNRSGYPSTP